jgi:hypothetical protein
MKDITIYNTASYDFTDIWKEPDGIVYPELRTDNLSIENPEP